MPSGISIPPWLNPPDYTGAYLHGAQIGASMHEAQARLQQAAQEHAAQMQLAQQKLAQENQQTQMELEMKQQLHQQNAAQEQQKLEIAKQYHQIQSGLRQQQLDETAKMGQMKIQQAAQRAQVVMQAQQRIKAGEDDSKVWMELGPQAGMPLGSIPSLINHRAEAPSDVKVFEKDGEKFYDTGSRIVHIPRLRPPTEGRISQVNAARLRTLNADKKSISDSIARISFAETAPTEGMTKDAKQNIENYKVKIQSLRKELKDKQDEIDLIIPPKTKASAAVPYEMGEDDEGYDEEENAPQEIGPFKVRVIK